MLLRGTLSQLWVQQLKNVTDSLNNTPLRRLGWLKPIEIKSEIDSALVEKAKKEHGIEVLKEPTYLEQRENSENKSDLKVNDFVYKDFDSKLFDKSFDVSVQFFQCLGAVEICFLFQTL